MQYNYLKVYMVKHTVENLDTIQATTIISSLVNMYQDLHVDMKRTHIFPVNMLSFISLRLWSSFVNTSEIKHTDEMKYSPFVNISSFVNTCERMNTFLSTS